MKNLALLWLLLAASGIVVATSNDPSIAGMPKAMSARAIDNEKLTKPNRNGKL